MFDLPFTGFGPGAIGFFEGLAKTNSKAWFEANKPLFEAQVKAPLTRLLDEAGARYGGTVKIFRQHRDVRFSKDKSPYKLNTYGVVHGKAGRPYYASINAGGFYAGTGMYDMAKDQLQAMRTAIDGPAGDALAAALEAATASGLTRWTDSDLKTAPRGVAKDHPHIDLMRMKNLVLGGGLGPVETLDGRRPLEHAFAVWDAAEPVLGWLDAHVGPSALPRPTR